MKKPLLSLSIFLLAAAANAQCTPVPGYADSTFGVWPDTIQNFPGALQNTAYITDLNFKVPVNAGDIDPTYNGATISSFTVDSVIGLPPGMDYTCNISNCTYAGGANGCAQIIGTCSTPGDYNITIKLIAVVAVPIIGNINVPQSFTGYKINVAVLGISELIAQSVEIYPNPALSELSLSGLKNHAIETIAVFDANGNKVQEMNTNAYNVVSMDVAHLNSGMYFVHLSGAEGVAVKKFVKH